MVNGKQSSNQEKTLMIMKLQPDPEDDATGRKCYLCIVSNEENDPNTTHYEPSIHGICAIHAVALWEIASKGLAFDMRDSTVVVKFQE
jgi:hypothetical protein